MESRIRAADPFYQSLIGAVDNRLCQTIPTLIGKNEVHRIRPCGTSIQLMLQLNFLAFAQLSHYSWSGCDSSAFAIFSGNQGIGIHTSLLMELKLFIDQNGVSFEVHIISSQAQNFAFTQAGKKRYNIKFFEAVTFDCFQKVTDIVVVQWLHFFALHAGQGTGLSGICTDQSVSNALLEGRVKNSVDALDSLGGQRSLTVV